MVLEWVASSINFFLPSTAEAELQPRYLNLRKSVYPHKTDCSTTSVNGIRMRERFVAEHGLGFKPQKTITEVQIGAYCYGALSAINTRNNEEILVCYFVDEEQRSGKFWITKFELAGKQRKGHKSYSKKVVSHLMRNLTNATKVLCEALNRYPQLSPPKYSIFGGPRQANIFASVATPFRSSAESTCVGFPTSLCLSELSLLKKFRSISFTLAGIFDQKTPCATSTTKASRPCDTERSIDSQVKIMVKHALDSRKQRIIDMVMGKAMDMLGLDLEQSDCSSEASFLTDSSSSTSDSIEGESQSNGMSFTSGSASSRQQGHINSSSKRGKRKRDEEEEEGSKRPRYEASIPGCDGGKKKFACPYRKRLSQNDDLTTSCVHPFRDVHRVKEHLYRQHALSLVIHCARCFKRFKDSADLTKHLQPDTGQSTCNGPRPQPLIYFGQSTLLELKRRSAKAMSEEEKWRAVWTILFGDALDASGSTPSPYSEDTMHSQSWTGDEFSRYEHFQRHTLPDLVQQHIARRLDDENPAEHIAEAILSSVPEIIRAIQEEHNYGRGNPNSSATAESVSQTNTAGPSTNRHGSMFFVPPAVTFTADNTAMAESQAWPMATPVENSDSGYSTARVDHVSGQPQDLHAALSSNDALTHSLPRLQHPQIPARPNNFPESTQLDHPAQTCNVERETPRFESTSAGPDDNIASNSQSFRPSTQIPSPLGFSFPDDSQQGLYDYVLDCNGDFIF
ncbi:zinc finger c2h2-type protein [Diplodia corticola]|uniref:Zinc finger c2h2-type protein n=1 Tax=Diplodia corticola TaxID=236234 RepID=A0A1J9QY95_9PEZI|nr:zinc finger c2h2-type protein [Diplodia corticola]OJD33345.1 zinc finger c2h2-type protein [Diplodia corticola]